VLSGIVISETTYRVAQKTQTMPEISINCTSMAEKPAIEEMVGHQGEQKRTS